MADSTSEGTATQQLVTAIVSNLTLFGIFMTIFLVLRIKLKRMYEPKSSFDLINDEKKPEPLPKGLWQWFLPLLKKSDNFILQQAGLDGYFFLRYLFIICAYCVLSMTYIFPILFAVNASNGNHQDGVDQLAFQNVKHPGRYYAHIFCGWVFYWMFMFVIYRELTYYNSLREVVLSSPRYGKKLSSRTVLFQTVPEQYLSEHEFAKLFDGVKRVWITRGGHNELAKKVETRDAMVAKLENALSSYIRNAVGKIKKIKKKDSDAEISSDITQYVADKKRPTHKLKPIIGEKVDTISYLKEKIPEIDKEVKLLQANYINGSPFNSVFVEFESQYQAQVALQTVTHHSPLSMRPSTLGIEPGHIIWLNMRMFWFERIGRNVMAVAAIAALCCFWAIPVAFVGMVSSITYLTNKLPWLKFIYKLPDPLLGLLTSLSPTIALAWLMSFLPTFIRLMARLNGASSLQAVEYFTQQAFFAFQIIQVFFVTTLSSAITSTATQIAEQPTKAMSLLASNLPKSSNFFISYILLTGMSVSSGSLAQVIPLFFHYVFGYLLDKTPRKMWNRFTDLDAPGWGTVFPVYTNLAVIVFSYAIISPIILLFAAVGFFLLYFAYLYILTYIQKEAPDMRGMCYPRALFQTIVGIYIGQVCLLGLFAVGTGWGPIVLQVVALVVTVFVHLNLNKAFDHLMKYVPVDSMKPLDGKSDTPSFKNIYGDTMEEDDIKELPQFPIKKFEPRNSARLNSDKMSSLLSEQTIEYNNNVKYNEASENTITWVPLLADGTRQTLPHAPFYKRFFLPHIYCSFQAVKAKLPEIYGLPNPDELTSEDDIANAYDYPYVHAPCPNIWLARDPYGFSTYQVKELNSVVEISDANAVINEEGQIGWYIGPPTGEEPVDESKDSKDPFADNQAT